MKIINNNFSLLGTNCKFNAIPFKNNCVNCGAPRIEIGRFIMGTNNFCVRIMCVHIIKYRAFVFSGFSLPWKKQICVEYQYKCNSCCDNYYSSKKIWCIIWLRSTGINSGFSYPHLLQTIFPLGRIALHFSQKFLLIFHPVGRIYPQEQRQTSAYQSKWHCDSHLTNYVLLLQIPESFFQIGHIRKSH